MKDFAELVQFDLDPRLMRLLDEAFCRANDLVLLGKSPPPLDLPISLGMLNPSRRDLIELVETRLERKVAAVQLNDYEIERALNFGFSVDRSLERVTTSAAATDAVTPRIELDDASGIRFERGQIPARIVVDMLSQAFRLRATDVHIESYPGDVDVRFRIDGVLYQIATPISPENLAAVVNHVKALANLNIVERFQPQDGHFVARYRFATGAVARVNLRVSLIPGQTGEEVVFRFVYPGHIMYGLEELGMPPDLLERFRAKLHAHGGLFLVTGPTASGKTTTLYAALRYIANRRVKILTVEDPIEFELPKVNQKQIDGRMGFSQYVRAFLRQNPDVMMIGEIRDEETALVASRAAQIGHLVLSTLHTRDAVSAVARLANLGVEPMIMSQTLLGVVAQRLVRRLCPECREPSPPADALLAMIPTLARDLPFLRPVGCDLCRQTGFVGQVGVFEMLDFQDSIRGLFSRGSTVSLEREMELMMQEHMFDDGVTKVTQGLTTIEELVRVVPLPLR